MTSDSVPGFPDMTDVYTPALRAKARAAATEVGVSLGEGVYLWWHGPMFETPAEIRMAISSGCIAGGHVDRPGGHGCAPHGRRGAGHLAVHQPSGGPGRAQDHGRGSDRMR